jgi:hypothetical protein
MEKAKRGVYQMGLCRKGGILLTAIAIAIAILPRICYSSHCFSALCFMHRI